MVASTPASPDRYSHLEREDALTLRRLEIALEGLKKRSEEVRTSSMDRLSKLLSQLDIQFAKGDIASEIGDYKIGKGSNDILKSLNSLGISGGVALLLATGGFGPFAAIPLLFGIPGMVRTATGMGKILDGAGTKLFGGLQNNPMVPSY